MHGDQWEIRGELCSIRGRSEREEGRSGIDQREMSERSPETMGDQWGIRERSVEIRERSVEISGDQGEIRERSVENRERSVRDQGEISQRAAEISQRSV